MEFHDILAGIVVLIGMIGIVVPILPGLALQVAAVTIWAFEDSSIEGWVVLGHTAVLAVTASILKYLFPGRRLKEAGIPSWLLFTAVAVAAIGLFVVPVVGAPLGFVLTIYVFERSRKGPGRAWPSTKSALRAVFTSIGIELAGGFLIAVVFFTGVLVT
ncbi:MAG TPA: DUF456 domain-containing protein [Acidimicrobiia bacterium]|nr:DUF456 domain-containing protein [Acidimicrobiia bacterium]